MLLGYVGSDSAAVLQEVAVSHFKERQLRVTQHLTGHHMTPPMNKMTTMMIMAVMAPRKKSSLMLRSFALS
jgi:hypothetical protein